MTEILQHNRLGLALHKLKDGNGIPLLLLHGLSECSPSQLPLEYAGWRGAVHALDFTGHGGSDWPMGGGYTCEYLMADVDIALAHLGPCTITGRGLGAYVALLIAGARPEKVRGALLRDGPGLNGRTRTGPAMSDAAHLVTGSTDPYATAELSVDLRPADYAVAFARLSAKGSAGATPIFVAAGEQAEWLVAIMQTLRLERMNIEVALNFAQCVKL
jgi:pimeloyl-ACP methyl ester carboxylesterase